MTQRTWARIALAAATASTALVALALLVHLTVRDHFHRPAFLFYAAPWPLLAIGAALLAIFWRRHSHRGLAVGLAAASMLSVGMWLGQDWEWRPAAMARGELRAVLWNVDRPEARFAGVAQWLLAQDADVLAIAERQPRKKDRLARWRQTFPGYEVVSSKGEMLCLVRGELLSAEETPLGTGSHCAVIQTRVRGREVVVVQMDINAYPLADRRPPLGKLAEIAAQHRAKTVLVLGDFNTPRSSVCLAPLRSEAVNAFTAVGSGCAATWPMPLPVLSLDQVWSNARLRPVRCEHVSSWRSDHRAVVAEFDFVP